jgi:hypothetical protein
MARPSERLNVEWRLAEMREEGGPRTHCRAQLLPRGDISRNRSAKGWKCHTAPDCHWRIGLLHPMPKKNERTLRSGPMSGRPSPVLRSPRPRCAAGSIQGTAPVRWPDRKIRVAPSSQELAYASASKDFRRLPRLRTTVSSHCKPSSRADLQPRDSKALIWRKSVELFDARNWRIAPFR